MATDSPTLGIELDYIGATVDRTTPINVSAPRIGANGIGLIGAGAFARGVLLPNLIETGFKHLVSICSTTGLSAVRLAERAGFEQAEATASAVINNPNVGVVVVASRHDSHAEYAIEALQAGKHVFCEKPIALDETELDSVTSAWRSSGRELTIGFNRRWSPSVKEAKRQLSTRSGAKVINYRINAGPIGADHWYTDRRQGGRLLGEVCHFVDTCAALVDEPIAEVSAFIGASHEPHVASDVVLALRFSEGSLATITYASNGNPSTPKERIEILAGGHTGVIDDFRSFAMDGKTTWSGAQDKGHAALMSHFAQHVKNQPAIKETEVSLASTRAVLAALTSAVTGQAIHLSGDVLDR